MTTTPPDADVPAATAIRRRSIPNVSDDRLLRRLEYLRDYLRRSREWAEQKGQFRARVVEVTHIEDALDARRVAHARVTGRPPVQH